MNQKNYFISKLLVYPVILFLLLFSDFWSIPSFLLGLVIIIFFAIDLFKISANGMLFTPLLFSDIFMISFGLYELGLSYQISEMILYGKFLIVVCMFIWDIISSLNRFNFSKDKNKVKFDLNPIRLKRCLYVLFFISASCMLYEWFVFGEIPLFSKEIEFSRFTISVNPVIHILAVMNRIIVVLGVVTLKGLKKNKLGIILITIISFLLLVGLGARAEMLYPILILCIYLYFGTTVKLKHVFFLGLAAIAVIGIYPFLRKYSTFGESYINDLMRISRYKKLYFLTPLYESFAYNFQILNLDIVSFPNIVPFGYGAYTILSNLPFVNVGKSITEVQNQLLGNDFYAGLASTYLGSVYADYGFLGSCIFTAILGIIINTLFANFRKNQKTSKLLIYSYLFYGVLMGFYHYVFDLVFIFYLVVFIFVISFTKIYGGKKNENSLDWGN